MNFLILITTFAAVFAQCPPGLSPLQSNNGQLLSCSPQDVCSCQEQRLGATCQYSQQHSRYICCAGQAPQCGQWSSPLLSPTSQHVQCQSSSDCPSSFNCTQRVCCSSRPHPACSSGECMNGEVYVDGQCLDIVPIGSMCQRTEQCSGGSICSKSSRCECPYGTSNINGVCKQYDSSIGCELGMSQSA
ncbi:EB domain-containing protein [Trichostrongylus colubriformis]|uniref:EB domain-containing protein n=1 Tax=Trichostrongylus colubriformis TaxID=6319 RepID=A0AAN8F8T3_TRICO